MKNILLLIFLLISQSVCAAEKLDISAFATIPIQHDGRIKPIESFARAQLKSLSGHESINGLSAIDWLIETLFNPSVAAEKELIKIRSPDVLQMLNLPRKSFYSFDEVMEKMLAQREIIVSILQTSQDKWTQSQNDLIALQQKMAIYEQLLNSITPLLPLEISFPKNPPTYMKDYTKEPLTYRTILNFEKNLNANLKKILKEKGEDPAKYTEDEQQLTLISFAAANLAAKGKLSTIFTVIPETENWQTLWSSLSSKKIIAWQNLVIAYHSDNSKLWNETSAHLRTIAETQEDVSPARLNIEYTYNLLHPHEISMGLYILALIAASAGLLLKFPRALNASGHLLATGVIIHICGLAARIYILQRPPVSTLYETILFVGIIFVIYGLILWQKRKDTYSLIGAGLGGVTLHLISLSHAGQNDTLITLEAVLNTNFWLATHVLCITTGYAFCLITSAFAHLQLACHAFKKPLPSHLQSTIITAALLALFFSATGTVLGGIWADQSWGRFWGWDPKENGALLIVLWLIWVLHGRISGQMRGLLFQAGLAYLAVIVSLSWFGVNLLSVGLHAYGFTNSLAWGLSTFIIAETVLIAALWIKAHAR